MQAYASALGCGLLFGLGLAVSQMTMPGKVLGFLDVAGDWDPSLLFVLGSAVTVAAIAFRFARKMPKPIFDLSFEEPSRTRIDARLIGGTGLFGIGWGLAGYCPGPGIVSLARFAPDAFVFVATFLAGSWLYRAIERRRIVGRRRSDVAATNSSA
ncbi:MAG: transporter [Vulcanimicrobiaceae bacterium]